MASSSVPIPPRQHQRHSSSSYSSSPASSSFSSTPGNTSAVTPSSKGKGLALASTPERIAPRRPSLLGTSFSKSEHTVINLGHDEGPPRLVTCVKSSQGFDWNQELFLPSSANNFDALELEHKQDPVHDIVLSDEDAAEMLPK